MTSIMLLLCPVFFILFSNGICVDLEYSRKIVSDQKGDWFAGSLATSHGKLFIGAEYYNEKGSVVLQEGVRLLGPPDSTNFGEHVAVNQRFLLVTGEIGKDFYTRKHYVLVYKSNAPYNLVAKFPFKRNIWAVKITEDDTIIVSYRIPRIHRKVGDRHGAMIYKYDGNNAWSLAQKLVLSERSRSISVDGDFLVAGCTKTEAVDVFRKVDGQWVRTQVIKEDVFGFGISVAIFGNYMVASALKDRKSHVIFTYQLDTTTHQWIPIGQFQVPGKANNQVPVSAVMHKDVLVVPINDEDTHPDVSGYVYKLTKDAKENENDGQKRMFSAWNQVARLTTKTDQLTDADYQTNLSVAIGDNMVFIGREAWRGDGKVFVYDISQI